MRAVPLRESRTEGGRPSNGHTAKIRSEIFQGDRRRKFFRVVAKHAYPRKTVPHVHALTGYPERTIYDWMAGNSDAPYSVLLQLFGEIASDQ